MFKKLFKIKAIVAMFILAILGIGTATLAGSTAVPAGGFPIESKLDVANATSGDGKYHGSVSAKVDEVVKFEVWYHNPEPATSNHVIKNVNVKVNIPGSKTKVHTATSTVGGSNSNTVTDTATVNTSIDTTLEYIPGTAYRRHNIGTNARPNIVTVKIPDSVVSTGYTIANMNPCYNFQETITVQARVKAPLISIVKNVKIEGSNSWKTSIEAKPGDTLAYLITVKNEGNTTLNNVVIRDSFPTKLQYVSGSAKLVNTRYPNGFALPDNLTNGGVIIGNYLPGGVAYVRFNAKVPAIQTETGCYTFTNVGVTKADRLGEFYNTAIVRSCYKTQPGETEIRVIKFHDRNGDKVQDNGEENLSGWQFRVTGEGFDQTVTTDNDGLSVIEGLKPGEYTVTEQLKDGWENTTGVTVTRRVTTDPNTQTFIFGNKATTELTETGKGNLPTSGPAETAAATFGSLSLTGGILSWIRSKKRMLKAFRQK